MRLSRPILAVAKRRRIIVIKLSQQRFEALAGYTRLPHIVLLIQEAAWFSTEDERLLGLITWDRNDRDFGWVVLGRDQRLRYRAIDHDVSLPTFVAARERLSDAIDRHAALPDEAYHQGDERGPPVDFFAPRAPPDRLNATFRILTEEARYSPARELIAAMMRFHEDADGNFVQQFQTTAFDPRIWELYLFAAFTELGYAQQANVAVPDFVLAAPRGELAVEATTINPPQHGTVPHPKTERDIRTFGDNYVQIKLARVLTRKLNHQPPYWALPAVADIPFVLALQDFHAPGAMSRIVMPATEYVFGVRHSIVDGQRRIERLDEHVYGRNREPSHFFGLPGSENVSAVMLNPLGTITKFNRMGYIAGFGDRRIKMVRSGLRRGELDDDGPAPKEFRQNVQAPDYQETWIEGAVFLHNPNARVPLDPNLIPDVNHEFLQPDGSIMSLLPPFQPYISHTSVTLGE